MSRSEKEGVSQMASPGGTNRGSSVNQRLRGDGLGGDGRVVLVRVAARDRGAVSMPMGPMGVS